MGCNQLPSPRLPSSSADTFWNVETFLGASGIGHVQRCANQVQPAVHSHPVSAPWFPAGIVIVVSPGIRTTTGESTSEMPADYSGWEATYQLLTPRQKSKRRRNTPSWCVWLGWVWTARPCLSSMQHHVQGKVASLRGPGEGFLESRGPAQTDAESRMTAERRSGGSILFHFSEQHCVSLVCAR